MLYFQYDGDSLVGISMGYILGSGSISAWEMTTFEKASKVAQDATNFSGHLYIAVENNYSPRYAVVKAPCIGDQVSRSFNGDSYPAGIITRVSASLKRVETDTGVVFWRKKKSSLWVNNKCWNMSQGHRNTINPHF
jgi:hypothetical protein